MLKGDTTPAWNFFDGGMFWGTSITFKNQQVKYVIKKLGVVFILIVAIMNSVKNN